MAVRTVQPSGGDFTTLAAALADAGTVAGDIIEISGDWSSTSDTSAATVSDDNITIRTKAGDQARHAGFDNGGSNYELAVSGAHCITVNNTGCTIDGLLILQNGSGGSDEGIRMAVSGGTLTVINSIIRAASAVADQDGVYTPNINATVNLENVMITGFGRCGCNLQMNSSAPRTQTWNIISCTLWNNARNVSEIGAGNIAIDTVAGGDVANVNVHNSIAVVTTSGGAQDFRNVGTAGTHNWQIDNCISSDASITARDASAVNATENATVTDGAPGAGTVVALLDITTAPFDLRLQDDANNDAQDQHGNATGAGLTIGDHVGSAVDIAGTTRPQNTNYDIGAFEVAATGGAAILKLLPEAVESAESPVLARDLVRPLGDPLETGEILARALGRVGALAETVAAAETSTKALGKTLSAVEVLEAAETRSPVLALNRSRSEIVAAPEDLLAGRVLVRPVAEDVAAEEGLAPTRGLALILAEVISAVDLVVERLIAVDVGIATELSGRLSRRIALTAKRTRFADFAGRRKTIIKLEGRKR